jgi:hypothetical protein
MARARHFTSRMLGLPHERQVPCEAYPSSGMWPTVRKVTVRRMPTPADVDTPREEFTIEDFLRSCQQWADLAEVRLRESRKLRRVCFAADHQISVRLNPGSGSRSSHLSPRSEIHWNCSIHAPTLVLDMHFPPEGTQSSSTSLIFTLCAQWMKGNAGEKDAIEN